MKKIYSLMILSALSVNAHAVPIAIVDSGTDLNHSMLKDKMWTNLKDEDDAVDNDDNGFIDDTHGWNFAENNNKLFDKRLIGKFSKDVYTFFEYQMKRLKGTASQAEVDWMKSKIADSSFLSQLQLFGNFAHGTHVAGIASRNSTKAEIMPLKLIPTKTPKLSSTIENAPLMVAASKAGGDENKKKLVLMAMDLLSTQQAKAFAPISAYIHDQKAKVANCSFGSSFTQMKALFKPLLSKVFGRELEEAEINSYVNYFMAATVKNVKASFIAPAPNTLFVIAAGNDGTDNDAFPASPANVKADNTITVAATNGYGSLAVFSNYGTKMVDVAAPGVGILSSSPGEEMLYFSGTSQASPFVANIAGQILDANPKLSPAQVKKLIMGTVDTKSFLTGKVVSGGIANTERAVYAAKLSLTQTIEASIEMASKSVRDHVEENNLLSTSDEDELFVLPLPNLGM